jgi:ribosomal protein S14
VFLKKLKSNKVQRYFFLIVEIKLLLLKFILLNKTLFSHYIVENLLESYYYNNSDFYKSKINSICILTGRQGSIYRYFRVSRIFLRKFGGSNFIYGLRKSSW